MSNTIPQNDPPIKHCPKCPEGEQWHPATTEFFSKDKRAKDGLDRWCKKCKNAYYRTYNKRPEAHAYQKEWRNRPENQDSIKSAKKAYRSSPKGRERETEYRRTYEISPEMRERHREAAKPWVEAYLQSPEYHAYQEAYASDPEVQEHKKTYRASERGLALHRANSSRRRARQKSIQGDYTPEQIQDQLKRQKHKCYYAACGFSKFQKVDGKYVYHVEHTYPLSRAAGTDIPANDISYIVLACPSCNMSKGDKLPHEWIEGGRLF